MGGFVCGIITLAIGVVLVIVSSIVGYSVIPNLVDSRIADEMTLIDDTIQLERFEAVPFPLNFTIRFFNISNANEVLAGGVPIVNEVGPYTYKLYSRRVVEELSDDEIKYRRLESFEFDPLASYPNTEEDIVSITNAAYHPMKTVTDSTQTQFSSKTVTNAFLLSRAEIVASCIQCVPAATPFKLIHDS